MSFMYAQLAQWQSVPFTLERSQVQSLHCARFFSMKTKPFLYKTYLQIISNSVSSRLFRNSYMKIGRKTVDILENGNLSCAFYVSSLLSLFSTFRLLKTPPHGTVTGTIKDMKSSGWYEIKKLKPGAILLWEEKKFRDEYAKKYHKHLGFYIGNKEAISNSSKYGTPIRHPVAFGDTGSKKFRKIEKIFWHRALNT